jgi:hypothetical protein
MALDTEKLTSDLTAFLGNLPATEAGCAAKWRDILDDYTATMVPLPAGRSGALAAFQAALTGMSATGGAATVLVPALTDLGAAYAGGVYFGAEPPTPIVLPAGTYTSVASAVTALVSLIDEWFRTGTSNGIPWS